MPASSFLFLGYHPEPGFEAAGLGPRQRLTYHHETQGMLPGAAILHSRILRNVMVPVL